MKINLRGDMTVAELRQALYEIIHHIEDDYGLTSTRGATLYINPIDSFKDRVPLRTRSGREVRTILAQAPYNCAADQLKVLVGPSDTSR